jgi:hypothetical protein
MKPKLNPVTVPPEILALPDTTLSEKLALAIFAADPKATGWRVLLPLSLTRVGFRKLKTKLGAKGLLTGHKVSGFEAQQTAQKVAQPCNKPAAAPDTGSLLVHAELLDIKYLMASEKIILAFYIAHPDATNVRVFTELDISPAGLKKLKAGLIEKQVLVPINGGFTVRLPGLVLVRDEQGGHFLSETEAVENGQIIAHASPKLIPALDIFRKWIDYDNHLEKSGASPGSRQCYADKMAKRVENESPDCPKRADVLGGLKNYANVCFALEFVRENASKKVEKQLINQVVSATPELLAVFREQVEGMALAGVQPQKLLGFFDEARPAAAGTNGANGSQQPRSGSQTTSGSNEAK